MSFTVKATQGGSAANGMILRLYVITGAKKVAGQTGGSASAQTATSTSATATGTVQQASSFIYGGFSVGTSASMTLTGSPSGVTNPDNITDATNSETYATFKWLAPSTGSQTIGLTSTVSQNYTVAWLEILAAAALAEDASSPALAQTTSATNVQTAAFSPPPGSLLVAIVTSDGGASVTTMSMSDTSGLGLNWTEKIKFNGSGADYAGVWIADVPASGSILPQPGSSLWQRRNRRRQTPILPPAPAAAAPVTTAAPQQLPRFPRLTPSRARIGKAALCAAGVLAASGVVTAPPRPPVPVSHPQPARARVGAQGRNAGGVQGPVNHGFAPPPLWKPLAPRLRPQRAVIRGVLGLVNQPLGFPQPTVPVVEPGRGPSRAVWHGNVGPQPTTAAVVAPSPKQLTQPRRTPGARARLGSRGLPAAGVAGPVNHGYAPPPRPRPFIPHLGPQRAVWRGGPAAAPVAVYQASIPALVQPGTRPSRAVWRGVTGTRATVVSVTALRQATQPRSGPPSRARLGPRSLPAGGNLGLVNQPLGAPQPTVPVIEPGRGPSRAVWRGNPVRTPATAGVAVPPPRQIRQPRSPAPSRAVWRGSANQPNQAQPVYQPVLSIIISRGVPSRAVWRGNQVRITASAGVAVPPPRQTRQPRSVPPSRGRWQRVTQPGPPPAYQPFIPVVIGAGARSPAPQRATWRGNPVKPPAVVGVAVPAPKQTQQPRSPAPRRAVWRGNVGLVNQPLGAPQPTVPVVEPGRGPQRAVWRSVAGQATSAVAVATPAPRQVVQPRPAPLGRARTGQRSQAAAGNLGRVNLTPVTFRPRLLPPWNVRRPQRALWRGVTSVATQTAAVTTPAPKQLTQPRPTPASRAKLGQRSLPAAGVLGRVNHAATAPPAPRPFIPHPQPSRAIGHGIIGPANHAAVPAPLPRPFIPHPQPQRAVWRGILGGPNRGFAPPPGPRPFSPHPAPVRAKLGQLAAAAGGVLGRVNLTPATFRPRLLPPWNKLPPRRGLWRGIIGAPSLIPDGTIPATCTAMASTVTSYQAVPGQGRVVETTVAGYQATPVPAQGPVTTTVTGYQVTATCPQVVIVTTVAQVTAVEIPQVTVVTTAEPVTVADTPQAATVVTRQAPGTVTIPANS